MIHFVQDLYDRSLKEIMDMADVLTDFNDIERIINSKWTLEILNEAYRLHQKLLVKYPTINLMLDTAEKMQRRSANCGGSATQSNIPAEIKALNQDKYGILSDVLLKKSIIKSVDEFIDYVD